MNKVSGSLPPTHALPALQVGDSGKQSTMHFVPQSDMAYWDKVLKYILALLRTEMNAAQAALASFS